MGHNITKYFILIFLLCFSVKAEAYTRWSEDFETISTVSEVFADSGNTGNCTKGAFEGRTNAMRCTLDRTTDSDITRSEVTRHTTTITALTHKWEWERSYIIEFDVFFDTPWVQDNTKEIFFQLHATPDDGEGGRQPPIALELTGDGTTTNYLITLRGDTAALSVTEPDFVYSYEEEFTLTDAEDDIGNWTRWKIETYQCYTSGCGYTKIWKDGVVVVNKSGIETGFNDVIGNYTKFGVYKYPWSSGNNPSSGTDSRIYYYDNMSVKTNNVGGFIGASYR